MVQSTSGAINTLHGQAEVSEVGHKINYETSMLDW